MVIIIKNVENPKKSRFARHREAEQRVSNCYRLFIGYKPELLRWRVRKYSKIEKLENVAKCCKIKMYKFTINLNENEHIIEYSTPSLSFHIPFKLSGSVALFRLKFFMFYNISKL